jgi:hypothetical protein
MPVVFPQLVQPSRLQQGHSDIRILAEARGEQASGRTDTASFRGQRAAERARDLRAALK